MIGQNEIENLNIEEQQPVQESEEFISNDDESVYLGGNMDLVWSRYTRMKGITESAKTLFPSEIPLLLTKTCSKSHKR